MSIEGTSVSSAKATDTVQELTRTDLLPVEKRNFINWLDLIIKYSEEGNHEPNS